MGKWQKKNKTKQKVNTYLSKHFKKMKVKFKEKPNIEEKKVNLEEATLSNTSVIRPVCVCVCVEGTARSIQCKLVGPRRLFFVGESALREKNLASGR